MEQGITANDIRPMLEMACHVGCEPEQMQRFLEAGYFPLPRALEFHAAAREPIELVAYGGPRGEAKSHAVFAQVGLDDCQRNPGSKWLYLRKIQKKAGEQFGDLIGKIYQGVPHRFTDGMVKFPAVDSKIIVGGYRSESEIDGYIGIEYDGIIIEDATTLTKSKIDQIRGSLRTSKGFMPKLYMSFNPGGVGHQWARKMFYDPWISGTETDTRFIYAQRGDNPFINPSYRKYLDGLTGWLRRAWRDGDMEIAAGQYFINFDPKVHVRRFDDIDRFMCWGSLDYGNVHWNMTYLFSRIGEDVYIVDEHAARRKLVQQNADDIKAMLSRHNLTVGMLRKFVSGHDVFIKKEDQSIADEYEANGIVLERANINRINRAARMAELLGNPNPSANEEAIRPRLYIDPRCTRLIETLPNMQHDPNRTEDVLKVDCNPDTGEGGDDPYDAAGMGLMEYNFQTVGVHDYKTNSYVKRYR